LAYYPFVVLGLACPGHRAGDPRTHSAEIATREKPIGRWHGLPGSRIKSGTGKPGNDALGTTISRVGTGFPEKSFENKWLWIRSVCGGTVLFSVLMNNRFGKDRFFTAFNRNGLNAVSSMEPVSYLTHFPCASSHVMWAFSQSAFVVGISFALTALEWAKTKPRANAATNFIMKSPGLNGRSETQDSANMPEIAKSVRGSWRGA
jgi:hypothetical protein